MCIPICAVCMHMCASMCCHSSGVWRPPVKQHTQHASYQSTCHPLLQRHITIGGFVHGASISCMCSATSSVTRCYMKCERGWHQITEWYIRKVMLRTFNAKCVQLLCHDVLCTAWSVFGAIVYNFCATILHFHYTRGIKCEMSK